MMVNELKNEELYNKIIEDNNKKKAEPVQSMEEEKAEFDKNQIEQKDIPTVGMEEAEGIFSDEPKTTTIARENAKAKEKTEAEKLENLDKQIQKTKDEM
jgi:hypothetical protein